MQDAARLQAAIECLDAALAGKPLERVLTGWGRANRFAGSKDRAAIRDLAYQAWRCRRSAAWLGGAPEQPTGRALMLGVLRQSGQDPEAFFTGARHAPAPLTEAEARAADAMPPEIAADLPDWQRPLWQERFGQAWLDQAAMLRQRAPIHLRVNQAKCDRDAAIAALSEAGVSCQPVTGVDMALEITEGAKALKTAKAFTQGWVELQDAASQALAAALPLTEQAKVLDFCAGGGGKSLALAARTERPCVSAHDVDPARMTDLAKRAERAQLQIERCDKPALAGRDFDLVLCDSPCSGSGSWRRDPDGKWALTPQRLDELTALQLEILHEAARFVRPSGVLAHATCSVFVQENESVVKRFLTARPDFEVESETIWPLGAPSDGFGLIVLRHAKIK